MNNKKKFERKTKKEIYWNLKKNMPNNKMLDYLTKKYFLKTSKYFWNVREKLLKEKLIS